MKIQYRRDLWRLLFREGLVGGIVEVGVAEGRFSKEMIEWPVYLANLFLVDRWAEVPGVRGDSANPQSWHDKNFEGAKERMAQYGSRVVFLRGESIQMAHAVADESLMLVYIDADHSYRGVMADIKAWRPKLVPNGIMAFHDYENPQYGVKQAVAVYCGEWGLKIHLLPEDKPEDAGAFFRC